MISISSKEVLENKQKTEEAKKAHIPVVSAVKAVAKKVQSVDPDPETIEPTTPPAADDVKALLADLTEQAANIFKQRAALSTAIHKAATGKISRTSIDIGTVLNKIDTLIDDFGNVKTFGLRYIKSGGFEGEMLDCRKGVKTPKQENSGKLDPKGKSQFSLKERGVIKMHNDEKGYRDITVACIYEFKDFKNSRWIRVRH